jgi:hypothetical protein
MKSRGGVFPVKRSTILGVLMLATLPFLTSSCGNSDKIASVSISSAGETGTINLYGLGATMQLQVLANYTSGKWVDETNYATYTVTAEGYYTDWSTNINYPMPTSPLTLTVNNTGMVTAVDPAVCSWQSAIQNNTGNTGWAYTGWYEITATYRGFTSQPIDIPVASAANGQPTESGQCGPLPSGD